MRCGAYLTRLGLLLALSITALPCLSSSEERLVVELKEQLWQLPAGLGFIPEAREPIGRFTILAVRVGGAARASYSP